MRPLPRSVRPPACAFALACASAFAAPEAPPPKETTAEGCVIERFVVPSPSMKREIAVVVLLPPAYAASSEKRFPVLFALHGKGAPYEIWTQMPKLRQQLRERPMIVASFCGDEASWYLDAPRKPDSQFTAFFFKEFVPAIGARYRVAEGAGGRAITGFSMGGFGAFHYTLEQPGFFSSVSSLSGAFWVGLDPSRAAKAGIVPLLGTMEDHPEDYRSLEPVARIRKAIAARLALPPLYLHCGKEDAFLKGNRQMRDLLKSGGYNVAYVESEGGHDWKFWKEACVGVLRFHWDHFDRR